MKKIPLILVVFTLVLATLACRLPFSNRSDSTSSGDTDVVTEEESPVEEEETAVAEPVEEEEETIESEETEVDVEPSDDTEVYSDNGVEITLPNSYMIGDVENDLAILVEGLQAMSEEDAEDIQELYDKNKDDVILWGYDTDSPSFHQTSLLVMKNDEFAGMSLTMISAFANVLLGSEVDSIEQAQITLGGKDVLRFLTTAENAGVETAQAIYLFNDSEKLWMVGFFTNKEQIEERLSTFDAAVASFSVVSEE